MLYVTCILDNCLLLCEVSQKSIRGISRYLGNSIKMAELGLVTSIYQCLKLRTKGQPTVWNWNSRGRKREERIKIHDKGFSEDTDEWRDYGSLFDREGFHTVSSPSAPQIHYSKFRTNISVRFSIHSTTLPVILVLPCSHVYKMFAVLKSSFWRRFNIRLLTTTWLTPDSSKIVFTTAAVVDS